MKTPQSFIERLRKKYENSNINNLLTPEIHIKEGNFGGLYPLDVLADMTNLKQYQESIDTLKAEKLLLEEELEKLKQTHTFGSSNELYFGESRTEQEKMGVAMSSEVYKPSAGSLPSTPLDKLKEIEDNNRKIQKEALLRTLEMIKEPWSTLDLTNSENWDSDEVFKRLRWYAEGNNVKQFKLLYEEVTRVGMLEKNNIDIDGYNHFLLRKALSYDSVDLFSYLVEVCNAQTYPNILMEAVVQDCEGIAKYLVEKKLGGDPQDLKTHKYFYTNNSYHNLVNTLI